MTTPPLPAMPLGVPLKYVTYGKASEFPPGSLIFAPYTWHKAELLQWGIKIGEGTDIFALTAWHSGRSDAGSIVQSRSDYPIFGLKADGTVRASVYLNQDARLIDAPDLYRGALGILGFSREGISLLSRANEAGWSDTVGYPINPDKWVREDPPPAMGHEAFTADWHVSVSIETDYRLTFTVDRGN